MGWVSEGVVIQDTVIGGAAKARGGESGESDGDVTDAGGQADEFERVFREILDK